ncbi:MAG: class I SAM-dependent methyltransferase [Acidobacteria bacterium]|nr:class I SAM-dependent methyltransferase [Acidobacteriota bacterium]
MTIPASPLERERAHENAWYARALRERFFEREGFRQLVAWNVAAIRRQVPLRPDMRVLSIGAGLGDYELALAPLVDRIVAVELSETAADAARQRLQAAGLRNVEVITGPIDTQPFCTAQFDLIYAMGVFHHFLPEQRRALLSRLHDWLAPGGWLYLRDPNARGLLRVIAERWFRRRSTVHAEQEASLDPYALTAEATASGFGETRIDYIDVIGGPLPWLLATESRLFWRAVFAADRAWLAVPGLRRAASQFALVARR